MLPVFRQSRQQGARAEKSRGHADVVAGDFFCKHRRSFRPLGLGNQPDPERHHVSRLRVDRKRAVGFAVGFVKHRLRLGYELIRAEDVPGMELVTQKTGEYAGCVAVNEMIAAKLPMSLYYRYMQEAHHDAPLREEDKLAETAQLMREQAERSGGRLLEGDGMSEMRDHIPRKGIFA